MSLGLLNTTVSHMTKGIHSTPEPKRLPFFWYAPVNKVSLLIKLNILFNKANRREILWSSTIKAQRWTKINRLRAEKYWIITTYGMPRERKTCRQYRNYKQQIWNLFLISFPWKNGNVGHTLAFKWHEPIKYFGGYRSHLSLWFQRNPYFYREEEIIEYWANT